jgi:hypothetical protein
MRTFASIFLLLFLSQPTTSVKLQCEYGTHWVSWHNNKQTEMYGCKATFVEENEPHYVVKVSNNHRGNQSPNDVKILIYKPRQIIPKLPKLTDKFFPELLAFTATGISLEVVAAVNFINFPKTLQTVYLFKNKLKEIPSDLFTYTPNLHSIALDRNMIQHVGNHFFDFLNLKKLERFTIKLNTCTKFPDIVNGDLKIFEKLRVELLNKCKPTDEMVRVEERKLSDRFDYLKKG